MLLIKFKKRTKIKDIKPHKSKFDKPELYRQGPSQIPCSFSQGTGLGSVHFSAARPYNTNQKSNAAAIPSHPFRQLPPSYSS